MRKVEPFDKRLKERAKQEPFPLPETYAGKVRDISPSISKITPCIITQAPFGEKSTYILYCTMFFRF